MLIPACLTDPIVSDMLLAKRIATSYTIVKLVVIKISLTSDLMTLGLRRISDSNSLLLSMIANPQTIGTDF